MLAVTLLIAQEKKDGNKQREIRFIGKCNFPVSNFSPPSACKFASI